MFVKHIELQHILLDAFRFTCRLVLGGDAWAGVFSLASASRPFGDRTSRLPTQIPVNLLKGLPFEILAEVLRSRIPGPDFLGRCLGSMLARYSLSEGIDKLKDLERDVDRRRLRRGGRRWLRS